MPTENASIVVDSFNRRSRAVLIFDFNHPHHLMLILLVMWFLSPTANIERRQLRFLPLFVLLCANFFERVEQLVGIQLPCVIILDVAGIVITGVDLKISGF